VYSTFHQDQKGVFYFQKSDPKKVFEKADSSHDLKGSGYPGTPPFFPDPTLNKEPPPRLS
jgi:hypothetical protein